MPTLPTFIQHSSGGPRHGNQTTQINKRHPDWQGKHQKRKLHTTSPDEHRYRNTQQNITKPNSKIHKKYHSLGFIPGMQGCYNI